MPDAGFDCGGWDGLEFGQQEQPRPVGEVSPQGEHDQQGDEGKREGDALEQGSRGSAFKTIARPAYGDDAGRAGRVGFDFLPQPADVNVHGAGAAGIAPAPDGFHQLVAGEDVPAVPGEIGEQFVFLGFEGQRDAAQGGFMAGDVDLQVAVGKEFAGAQRVFRGRGLLPVQADAPQEGFDARLEFTHGEGFGEVVIRADFKTDDAVNLGVAGGEHEDGDAGFLAQDAANFDAVHDREHDIEQDQVGGEGAGDGEGAGPVAADLHLVALAFEVVGERFLEGGFVFDDEDFVGHGEVV